MSEEIMKTTVTFIKEFCEKNKIDCPKYTFTGTKSPFTCKVELMGLHGSAEAATMQAAKEKAAQNLFSNMTVDDNAANGVTSAADKSAEMKADSKKSAARSSAEVLKTSENLKREGSASQRKEKETDITTASTSENSASENKPKISHLPNVVNVAQKKSVFSELENYCQKMKLPQPVYLVTHGPDDLFTCKVNIHGIKVLVVAGNEQTALTTAAKAMLGNIHFWPDAGGNQGLLKKIGVEVDIQGEQDEPEMSPHVSEIKDDLAPDLQIQNQVGSSAICALKLYCDKKKITPIYAFTTDASDKLGRNICELRLEGNEVSAKAAKKKTAKELASAKMLNLLEPLS